jgi:hypothetical protein
MATAHRRLPKAAAEWLPEELLRVATRLRDEHGTVTGCSGLAIGGDTLWADAILAAGLTLWAHVPCEDQPHPKWTKAEQRKWAELRAIARTEPHRETVYGDGYSVGLLHARNDGMLDAAKNGAVIAVWDPASDPRSGTRSCVLKALKRGLPIIWINPAAEPGQRCARLVRPETLWRLLAT